MPDNITGVMTSKAVFYAMEQAAMERYAAHKDAKGWSSFQPSAMKSPSPAHFGRFAQYSPEASYQSIAPVARDRSQAGQ